MSAGNTARAALRLLLIAAAISGCGQKGPLILPASGNATAPAGGASAATR